MLLAVYHAVSSGIIYSVYVHRLGLLACHAFKMVAMPGLPRCKGEIYLRHTRVLPTLNLQIFLDFPYHSLTFKEVTIDFPYNSLQQNES